MFEHFGSNFNNLQGLKKNSNKPFSLTGKHGLFLHFQEHFYRHITMIVGIDKSTCVIVHWKASAVQRVEFMHYPGEGMLLKCGKGEWVVIKNICLKLHVYFNNKIRFLGQMPNFAKMADFWILKICNFSNFSL